MKSKFNKVCLICGLVSGIWGTIAIPTALAGKTAKETQARPTAAIVDVALSDQATLTGRLTTPDGTPLNQRIVTLSSGTTVLKTTKSDSNGYFVFDSVSAGSLAVASDDCSQHLRVWTKASAPPIAQSEAKLVCSPAVVRGQFGNTIGGLTVPSIHPA
ncbi:MAG: carboxypeptidase-like regulatory domain-containing protein, partial [Planctomycetales bacterium]